MVDACIDSEYATAGRDRSSATRFQELAKQITTIRLVRARQGSGKKVDSRDVL